MKLILIVVYCNSHDLYSGCCPLSHTKKTTFQRMELHCLREETKEIEPNLKGYLEQGHPFGKG
jgi:hypothetical protein